MERVAPIPVTPPPTLVGECPWAPIDPRVQIGGSGAFRAVTPTRLNLQDRTRVCPNAPPRKRGRPAQSDSRRNPERDDEPSACRKLDLSKV